MKKQRRAIIKERDVQRAVVELLMWQGWMVREISQPRAVFGSLIGVPDVIAWKNGVSLLIECKKPGGKLRESQKNFFREISPHLSTALHYFLVFDATELVAFLGDLPGK